MVVRIVVAVALFAILAGVAWWLERRRGTDAPTQGRLVTPTQLNRRDFDQPDTPWLIVLFTSSACDSCEGLYDKAAPLAGPEVAVVELEFPEHRDMHERYHVEAAPMTLVADRDGVVQATFLGAFPATDLWSAVAALRDGREIVDPNEKPAT